MRGGAAFFGASKGKPFILRVYNYSFAPITLVRIGKTPADRWRLRTGSGSRSPRAGIGETETLALRRAPPSTMVERRIHTTS